MTNRTVKFQGWGTGTTTITATLDGEIVFSGAVELVEFDEDNSSHETAPTLFTVELPVEFGGTKQMKITVDNAPLRFGQIVANYTEVDWGETYYTGPYEFDDIAPRDDAGSRDPRSNVRINGIAQKIDRQGLMGTWHWHIDAGSIFEHDLNIALGSELEF
jgi:hypothetical protein